MYFETGYSQIHSQTLITIIFLWYILELTTSYATILESTSMMLTTFRTTRTTFTTPLGVTSTGVGILNPTANSSSAGEH